MTRPRIVALAFPAALVLAACTSLATAAVVQKGNLRVTVTGKVSPRTLPRQGLAPIAVSVGGRVTTTDKSTPPQLQELKIEINREGRLDYAGLPVCPLGQIQPASDARALSACRSALVGRGSFSGAVLLPGQAPYPISGNLLVFNGREGGRPVLFGHIYSPRPFSTSFVIPFRISTEPHGTYGTILTADLTRALGSERSLSAIEMTLQRRYTYRGQAHSYLSAGCPAPKGFPGAVFPLMRTSFGFAGGRSLTETLNQSCKAGR